MRELALTIDQFGEIKPPGDLKIFGLNSILQTFISLFFLGAILLSLTYLIWGAIDYIMSEGDKQRLQASRQKFIFAIIGLIVVLTSFAIIGIVGNAFGVNLLNLPFTSQNPCINKLPGKPC